MPSDKLTVPAHERRRRHEKGHPALMTQQPRKHREHSTIGGGVPRTRHLATKDAELMAEYRDLEVLLSSGAVRVEPRGLDGHALSLGPAADRR